MQLLSRITFPFIFLFFFSSTYAQTDKSLVQVTSKIESLEQLALAQLQNESKAIGLVLAAPQNTNGIFNLSINGEDQDVLFVNGFAEFELEVDHQGELVFITHQTSKGKAHKLYHYSKNDRTGYRLIRIPLWLSILPPLIAILLALVFKEVIISLFVGIWSGAFIAGGLKFGSFFFWFKSLFDTISKYIVNALNDSGHISVIVFSLLIGGMVAIISKNGGMTGVVQHLSKYAKTPKSTQFVTWLLGIAIFFDDYANTLIVGNTMRSVTDKFRISREKLAYIVDSTAAPVAAIAFITTWIGAELGYIDDGLGLLALDENLSAYGVFLKSLKYSFYPILTLSFILLLIKSGKDYGPMHKAEQRAFKTGQVSPAKTKNDDEPDMEDLSPVKGATIKWYNAAIPIFVVIATTIIGLLYTGISSIYAELIETKPNTLLGLSSVWGQMDELGYNGFFNKLGGLIGSSDSYVALLWASGLGVIMAIALTVSQRIMNLFDSMHWMTTGFKTMLPAIIILTLAWSLALTTSELHTADFISSSLQNAVNPYVLPMIVFVLAALIAFSTGSSWSTMAILYPIVIPTSYTISQANGLAPDITMELLFNCIATVLGASVLGDHCSPISDTTILSSLASDCNHIDHVRTQMPYALTVGLISLLCCGLSTFLGGGILISIVLMGISILAFYFLIKFIGSTVNEKS